MKKTFLLVAAAIFAAGVSAQNKITVENLSQFSTLQANGKIELFVTIDTDAPGAMSIDMNGNDPNQLKWWDTEGVLQIKYSPKSKANPVIIRLNCHKLTDLELTGVSMVMESKWVEKIVTISLSSSSKLTAEIEAKDLRVTSQTSSTAVIKGKGWYADYDIRSKSVFDARNYAAESANLRAAGYSESYIYGVERMVIYAADGGSVFYRGMPEIFRENTLRGGHSNSIGE